MGKDVLTRVVQQDCELLEKEFELDTPLTFENPQVLLLPTEPAYHWFWERSNFHAVEVENKATISRLGAYVPDTPYFVTWYPDYLEKLLVILRIRLPDDEPNAIFEGFMRLAHEEARNNALPQVVIWNLDNKELQQHYGEEKGFAWVTRTRTLSSMAWLPDLNRTVDWYHNEKFCWA
ncbi:hypothetical protein K7432_017721 [Basidiobolus ranarum]|uniref:LYC1 C-terminal domain-containing protein n=1 Tax=Basidiobolus ranarum TaxID=34480 RepID=A0ABR2VK38_9FUNG